MVGRGSASKRIERVCTRGIQRCCEALTTKATKVTETVSIVFASLPRYIAYLSASSYSRLSLPPRGGQAREAADQRAQHQQSRNPQRRQETHIRQTERIDHDLPIVCAERLERDRQNRNGEERPEHRLDDAFRDKRSANRPRRRAHQIQDADLV